MRTRSLMRLTALGAILSQLVPAVLSFVAVPAASAASSSNSVSIETKLSSDGSTFLTDLTGSNAVDPGQTITVRVAYNNAGSVAYGDVSLKGLVPSGFGYVSGTTKNCITPSGTETVCNTHSGQAGSIPDSVWEVSGSEKYVLLSPTAGLYDISPSQTVGILEIGKIRYWNFQNCNYINNVNLNTDDIFGFQPGNTAIDGLLCEAGVPGTTYQPHNSWAQNLDMLATRYPNMHNCDYINNANYNTDDSVRFYQSNAASNGLNCLAATIGTRIRLQNSSYVTASHLGYRYANFQNCDYINNYGFNTDDVVGLVPSNSPQTALTCGTAFPGTSYRPQNSMFQALDLLDTTRGQGYIEFKVTAPTTPGTYTVSSLLSSSTLGATLQDDGLVEVKGTTSSSSSSSSSVASSSSYSSSSSVASSSSSSSSSSSAAQCSDGIDNDGDGKIDYNDPGCYNNGVYTPTDTSEADALAQCADGVDNDGDGKIDYFDPGCYTNGYYNPADTSEVDVVVTYACSDGVDNDGDGKIDLQDPGCTSSNDNDEHNAPQAQCSDGIDNDGDGKTDFFDPGCYTHGQYSPHDDSEVDPIAAPACRDGIDNDGDGKIDLQDPGCTHHDDNDETNHVTPVIPQCSDGIDNDGDGRIDFFDSGCYPNGVFNSVSYTPNDNSESGDVTFGCIEVTKEAYNNAGIQLSTVPQFRFTLNGRSPKLNNSTGKVYYRNIVPGSHTVAEVIPSGWTQMSVSPAGGSVTVTGGSTCAQVKFQNRQIVP